MDADGIVCKFWTGNQFSGTSPVATVNVQTTEDGGTTWRDCATWVVTSVINADVAHFQPIYASAVQPRGVGNWIGSVAASSLSVATSTSSAVGIVNGLPMMSPLGRVYIAYTGTVASNAGVNVDVFAPTSNHSN